METHSETVAAEITCIQCGYPLRGLLAGGRCPECGAAIGLSLHGDILANAHRPWLDHIKLGAKLMHGGLWMLFFGFIGLNSALAGSNPIFLPAIATGVTQIVIELGLLVVLVGGSFLTAAEPRTRSAEMRLDARRLARALCLGLVVFLGLSQLVLLKWIPPNQRVFIRDLYPWLVVTLFIVASLLLTILLRLIERLPDRALSIRLRRIRRQAIILGATWSTLAALDHFLRISSAGAYMRFLRFSNLAIPLLMIWLPWILMQLANSTADFLSAIGSPKRSVPGPLKASTQTS